jgi:hypothetical protein
MKNARTVAFNIEIFAPVEQGSGESNNNGK